MKKISIVSGCYNEEENVKILCDRIKKVFSDLPNYTYEHIFIDNASTDKTVEKLKEIAQKDKHIKIIVNAKNFGHIRSPYHAILQAKGDIVITIVSDLQDPPEIIPDFIKKWEEGYQIIVGVKRSSKENPIMFKIREFYYYLLKKSSDTKQIQNFTGFGLYDKSFINTLRSLKEPYPYFRGLVSEFGGKIFEMPYDQPIREFGITKNNFYTLYDMAMTGFVNHSKMPLRLSAFIGFISGTLSFLVALIYFIYKLLFWQDFQVGTAPLVIGLFFFSSIQLFFIGIIGEYIGAIYTRVQDRPLVVEKERVNFDND